MKTNLKTKLLILVLGSIILFSGCMSTLEVLDEMFLGTEQVASSKNGYAIGTYDTTYGKMELSQSGNMISGTYTGHTGSGTVEGTLDGNTLNGTWKDEDGSGRIAFVFTSDMRSFSGYWSYNTAVPNQERWDGNRVGAAPAQTTQPKPVAQPAAYTPAMRVVGTYDTTYGTMELSQSGSKISGTYSGYSGNWHCGRDAGCITLEVRER